MIDEWIDQAWSLGASDLHLETGTPPVARIRGELQTLSGAVPVDALVQAAQNFLGAEGIGKKRAFANVFANPVDVGPELWIGKSFSQKVQCFQDWQACPDQRDELLIEDEELFQIEALAAAR